MLKLIVATGEDLICCTPKRPELWRANRLISGRAMQCVAIDPRRPEVLYAGSRGEGVWRSDDACSAWTRLEFPEADVFALAVSPADGAVYAGTEPSKLFVSRDEGSSWRELTALQDIPSRPTWSFPPRPWTSHVRSIAPSPHDGQLLLAGIELGGIMRSHDGGETWSDHPPGAQQDVHALAWHPTVPGRVYEAGGGGAAWSRDGGLSWHAADAGRDRHYTWGLAVDPDDPECWFVSASHSARLAHQNDTSAEAHIYRWRSGGPWEALSGRLPRPLDSFPYALAMNSSSLFAGLRNGSIYQSHDRGEQWSQLPIRGDAPSRIVAMALQVTR